MSIKIRIYGAGLLLCPFWQKNTLKVFPSAWPSQSKVITPVKNTTHESVLWIRLWIQWLFDYTTNFPDTTASKCIFYYAGHYHKTAGIIMCHKVKVNKYSEIKCKRKILKKWYAQGKDTHFEPKWHILN